MLRHGDAVGEAVGKGEGWALRGRCGQGEAWGGKGGGGGIAPAQRGGLRRGAAVLLAQEVEQHAERMRARRGCGGDLARRRAGQPLTRLTNLRELRAEAVGGAVASRRWREGKVDESAGFWGWGVAGGGGGQARTARELARRGRRACVRPSGSATPLR